MVGLTSYVCLFCHPIPLCGPIWRVDKPTGESYLLEVLLLSINAIVDQIRG
jgi:hypothetical protein